MTYIILTLHAVMYMANVNQAKETSKQAMKEDEYIWREWTMMQWRMERVILTFAYIKKRDYIIMKANTKEVKQKFNKK